MEQKILIIHRFYTTYSLRHNSAKLPKKIHTLLTDRELHQARCVKWKLESSICGTGSLHKTRFFHLNMFITES